VGQTGLHHAARKWTRVVHPIWHLMGPMVPVFNSNSFFFIKTSVVFIPKFIFFVTCTE
jgi:hypothetical protein